MNMKNKLNLLAIPVLALVLLTGCKKALDLQPYTSVAVDVAFSNADKCLTSLYGVYDAAQSGDYLGGAGRGYPFGAANIEQGDARGEDVINIAAFYQITYQATYNATAANCEGHWNSLYSLINKANAKPKFKVRGYTRCRRCGRARSVYRKFGLCRVCLRELAHAGEIPGLTKSSW